MELVRTVDSVKPVGSVKMPPVLEMMVDVSAAVTFVNLADVVFGEASGLVLEAFVVPLGSEVVPDDGTPVGTVADPLKLDELAEPPASTVVELEAPGGTKVIVRLPEVIVVGWEISEGSVTFPSVLEKTVCPALFTAVVLAFMTSAPTSKDCTITDLSDGRKRSLAVRGAVQRT